MPNQTAEYQTISNLASVQSNTDVDPSYFIVTSEIIAGRIREVGWEEQIVKIQ